MEDENSKGCVYFFRHIGLTPVKIGYSANESPANRFLQFKTYAPYGSEIIGFIMTENAKELETKLHVKYASKRLSGEWFDITEQDCITEIDYHSNIEDVKERNNFQIAWANAVKNKNEKVIAETKYIIHEDGKKDEFLKLMAKGQKINIKETAVLFGVARQTLHKWIRLNKAS